ncbi:MAG: thiamine pyrophosphate-dependent enzyme [Rhodospirillaceae bacterium]
MSRTAKPAKAKKSANKASKASEQVGRNTLPLKLKIPEPSARPGEEPDFSKLDLSEPGAARRPNIDAKPDEMRDLAYSLVRVLDDDGTPKGPWAPTASPDVLRTGLRAMMLTRTFDDRMYRAQRQGKTSFYVKCTGEEAVAVAQALAVAPEDMCFPTYRQQGLFIARNYPLLSMMSQVYSNARDLNIFSIAGNLALQFNQAVGWAMGSALSGDSRIALSWIGDGSTAEGDFHAALTFAAVYHAPVILNIVNNQWAISSFSGIAGSEEAPFAARGIGYGLPALRVDGNDFLAVYAATQWAADRARANLGATLIELFTYRYEGHSTSDDPTRYRPATEGASWPLGDPIERLKTHLIKIGEWSESQHEELTNEIVREVREVQKEAESIGTLGTGEAPSPKTMFEDVFKEPDQRLRKQRQQAGF